MRWLQIGAAVAAGVVLLLAGVLWLGYRESTSDVRKR